jgi:uncharacterized repeat protein (TIGR04076 family)
MYYVTVYSTKDGDSKDYLAGKKCKHARRMISTFVEDRKRNGASGWFGTKEVMIVKYPDGQLEVMYITVPE